MRARRFSTGDVAVGERLDLWRDYIGGAFGDIDIVCAGERPFAADALAFPFPDAEVVFSRRSDTDVRYHWSSFRTADISRTALSVVKHGHATIVQRGEAASSGVGGAVVFSGAASTLVRGDYESVAIGLPVDRVRAEAPGFDLRRPLAIPADNPALRLLSLYLDVVRLGPATLDADQAGTVSARVATLALAAIGARVDVAAAAREIFPSLAGARVPVGSRPALVARARELIRRSANGPVDLGGLARSLGVSTRALQESFLRRYGLSPRAYLLQCRLERARDRLRLPSPADTVTGIALECGFSDLSHFAARYRESYGEPPSETFRAAQRRSLEARDGAA